MLCRRFQINASLPKLYFEFITPKTRLKVLLNSSRFITKGVEKKEDFRPTSRSSCRLCRKRRSPRSGINFPAGLSLNINQKKKKKKNSIRGYKMVDESVIGYSADGKDCPIPGHPCIYVARKFFFELLDSSSTCAHKWFSNSLRSSLR